MVFGTLAMVLGGIFVFPTPNAVLLILGCRGLALGIVGDLFESLLKRSAGVKDSSKLIPGHGGVLDRIDSWLFAAPVYYVFVRVSWQDHDERASQSLGSTGSIGQSALAVVDAHPERLRVVGLAAGENHATRRAGGASSRRTSWRSRLPPRCPRRRDVWRERRAKLRVTCCAGPKA